MKAIKHQLTLQMGTRGIYVPERFSFRTWTHLALRTLKHPVAVCFRLVDKQEMQKLNHTYRKKNSPTNVLSFPSEIPIELQKTFRHLGDIILCPEIINQEASEQNKTQKAHWAHMVIHGLLHLQGYDHENEKDASEMEALETNLLKKLNIENPYEDK